MPLWGFWEIGARPPSLCALQISSWRWQSTALANSSAQLGLSIRQHEAPNKDVCSSPIWRPSTDEAQPQQSGGGAADVEDFAMSDLGSRLNEWIQLGLVFSLLKLRGSELFEDVEDGRRLPASLWEVDLDRSRFRIQQASLQLARSFCGLFFLQEQGLTGLEGDREAVD